MRSFLLVILIALFPSFSLSDEVTAEAQRLLNELGYNAGPVDGLIGGKTRNAMSDAFKSVGKEWDRELDETDLAILRDILEQSRCHVVPVNLDFALKLKNLKESVLYLHLS